MDGLKISMAILCVMGIYYSFAHGDPIYAMIASATFTIVTALMKTATWKM